MLLARDALQSALVEKGMLGSTTWDKVNELDKQLRALAGKLYQVSDLPHFSKRQGQGRGLVVVFASH